MSHITQKKISKRHSNTDNDSFDMNEEDDSVLSSNFEECSPDDPKRTSRNKNEKNRRDQFNSLIQEISSMLNINRKTDKASVLNQAINFFHKNNIKLPKEKEISSHCKPFFIKNHEFIKFMFEVQNAFCLVFDLNGKIKYASHEIKYLLGYDTEYIQNKIIFELLDEKSINRVKEIIRACYLSKGRFETFEFDCNFRRKNNIELFKITGFFKRKSGSIESGHFSAIARIENPSKIYRSLSNVNVHDDFEVEFSLDLKFIKLDSEVTKFIGYTPMEMIGTSAYDYCHLFDLEKLNLCHKAVLQGKNTESLSLRFLTKGEETIVLDTTFLKINKINSIKCRFEIKPLPEYIPKDTRSNLNHRPSEPYLKNYKRKAYTLDENYFDIKESELNNELNENFQKKTLKTTHVEMIPQGVLILPKNSTATQKDEIPKHDLDESLVEIFLRSYSDQQYRRYVINQLNNKKANIERLIEKQQCDVKVLEDTIENISDVSKLGTWLMEFQKERTKLSIGSQGLILNSDNSVKNIVSSNVDTLNL